MKSTIFSSVVLFAAVAFSAPVVTPTFKSLNARNTTTSSGSSATGTILPDVQVRWSSKTPDAHPISSSNGHLLDSPSELVYTAVHFNGPSTAKTCKLVFELSNNDWAMSSSSVAPKFDIYRLQGCLNDDYTWSNQLAAGAHAGVLTPVKGAPADWEKVDMSGDLQEPEMGSAPIFSCGPGEYSFVMVARTGANIGWSGKNSGLRMETCG